MKIALATKNSIIDGHFGHCDYFTVFTVNTSAKEIISEERIVAPKGCGCSSNIDSILSDANVELLLTNNIGGKVLERLKNRNIEVVIGCTGNVREIALDWLNGKIKESVFMCFDHK